MDCERIPSAGAYHCAELKTYSTYTVSPIQLPIQNSLHPSNASPLFESSDAGRAHLVQESPSPAMSFQYPESNEENNPSGMSITAPVPLSYATRGKAAYQSILSVGDEDSPADESQEHVQPTSEHLGPNENMTNESVLPTDMQLFQWQEDLRRAATNQATQSQQTVQPSMIIRPISASTLIALTEPCLMKWCLDPDSELLSPLPSSSDPVVLPFTFNTGFQADMAPAAAPNTRVVNSWGY